jgi:hypothetical protein
MAGDIASELIVYLKAISGITDLVSSGTAARIYEDDPKQAVSLPYVVFEVFEGSTEMHLGGIAGVARNRIQIDAYAATKAGAFALAEQIKFAVAGYRGTMGSTFVHDESGRGSYQRGRDQPTPGGNQRRHWVSRDYILTYQEATS